MVIQPQTAITEGLRDIMEILKLSLNFQKATKEATLHA